MYYANLCSSAQLYYTGSSALSTKYLWQWTIKTLIKGSKYSFCGTFVTNMKRHNPRFVSLGKMINAVNSMSKSCSERHKGVEKVSILTSTCRKE